MLQAIVIVIKCGSGVVWRIYENAFDLAGKLLFKGFEREQVVAENEALIEQVVVSHAVRRVVGPLWILKQDARLQSRPALLPNPCEFEFLLLCHSLTNHPPLQQVPLSDHNGNQTVLSQPHLPTNATNYLEAAVLTRQVDFVGGPFALLGQCFRSLSGDPVYPCQSTRVQWPRLCGRAREPSVLRR